MEINSSERRRVDSALVEYTGNKMAASPCIMAINYVVRMRTDKYSAIVIVPAEFVSNDSVRENIFAKMFLV